MAYLQLSKVSCALMSCPPPCAGGDENFHIWAQPIGESTPARDLTPFDGVRAQNMMTDKHFPGEILVGLNKRNPQARYPAPPPGTACEFVPSMLSFRTSTW